MDNEMSKGIFLTGTGTDIGKTYIAGLITKKLHDSGRSAAYFKAAMSGNDRRADGTLIPGDADHVKRISGIGQPLEEMCPYIYENAYSPHLAARLEGGPVEISAVKEAYRRVREKYEFITAEGSGGILCPIRWELPGQWLYGRKQCGKEQTCKGSSGQEPSDRKLSDQEQSADTAAPSNLMLEDIIRMLKLPSLIVADAGLGTINSVVLTAEYMRSRDLPVKGIIFNHWHPGDVMEEDNKYMCETMTGLPVLACVMDGSTEFPMDAAELAALYE